MTTPGDGVDLDELARLAEAATPGPWHWSGNTKTHVIALCTWIAGHGRVSVMDFVRWGTRGAAPRFNTDMMMDRADTLVEWEVCKDATDPADPRLYRHDISGIRHADAAFIAACDPATVLALIERVREAEATRDHHELHRYRYVARADTAEAECDRLRAVVEEVRALSEWKLTASSAVLKSDLRAILSPPTADTDPAQEDNRGTH